MNKLQAVLSFQSVGLRPHQEDHFLVDSERGIFIVADGFGGAIPGATAAQSGCEAVKSFLFKEAGDLDATLPFVLRSYFSLAGNVLFNALVHANRKITRANSGKPSHEKGGASMLAGFLDGDLLALANVGVCSAWIFRGGLVAETVMPRTYARLMDPTQPYLSGAHRVPMMALGISEDLEPEIFECRIQKGDWLLLSTDGIVDDVGEIQEWLCTWQKSGMGALEAAQSLEEILKSKQFNDNLSASLVIF